MPFSAIRIVLAVIVFLSVCVTTFDLKIRSIEVAQPQLASHARSMNKPPHLTESYRNLPLSFEAAPEGALFDFVSRNGSYALSLQNGDAFIQSGSSQLHLQLIKSNHNLHGQGVGELSGKSNYLIGPNSRNWRTNVPRFSQVRYQEVWPGIDLIYHSNGKRLEYDFILAPDCNPEQIKFQFEGSHNIVLSDSGDLSLATSDGDLQLQKPLIYQELGGNRQIVQGSFTINDQIIGFEVGEYDHTKPLVIDPILSSSALLESEFISDIAVDAEGSIYVTGLVRKPNFPVSINALRTTRGNTDFSAAFVAKLDVTGTALVYSTYIGGFERSESPNGIAVDNGGNAYITGMAGSSDFPTTPNAFQQTFIGPGQSGISFAGDGFVLKLNPTGSALVYSTFLGGNGSDLGFGIAVDSAGNAYVTGATTSSDFPLTSDAPQRAIIGISGSGFITKLNPEGSALVWSTYLGRSSSRDTCEDIAVDSQGNAYVTGESFPNIFAAKVNSNGRSFGYYTRFTGNSSYSEGFGIAVDGASNAYITGVAVSGLQTSASAFQRTFGGATYDAFVARLNAAGGVAYFSYLGGKGNDKGTSIAVDIAGNAYVTGETDSDNFRIANAFQPNFGNFGNSSSYMTAFVTKVTPDGTTTPFSSYYGLGREQSPNITISKQGQVIIAGRGAALTSGTFSSTNPTVLQSPDENLGGFITKIDETATGTADLAVSITPNDKFFSETIVSYIVTVTNTGNVASAGPINLQFKILSNSILRTVSGEGWYVNGQYLNNPATLVFPGPLASGQSANLVIDFFSYVKDQVQASATINNISDGNPANNSATDTTTVSKGCFNGGSVRLSQTIPATGGTFAHPVNLPCTTPWKAVSNASWITINSGTTTGNGSFSYTVAPNLTRNDRVGTIVFEGIALELVQEFSAGLSNVSAASFATNLQGTQPPLAQNSIVALFGNNLAFSTQIADKVPLPMELAGVTVKIKDSFGIEHTAPLFFVSPSQINYLLPAETTSGYATITVSSAGKTQTGTIIIAFASPGLFSANSDGVGPPAGVLLRVKANGAQSYEPLITYDQSLKRYVNRPIDFGPDLGATSDQLYLIMFGTGFRNRSSLSNVKVFVSSGGTIAALYAGPQGDYVGLDQVNIQLNRQMINFVNLYLTMSVDGQLSNRLGIEFKQ